MFSCVIPPAEIVRGQCRRAAPYRQALKTQCFSLFPSLFWRLIRSVAQNSARAPRPMTELPMTGSISSTTLVGLYPTCRMVGKNCNRPHKRWGLFPALALGGSASPLEQAPAPQKGAGEQPAEDERGGLGPGAGALLAAPV